MTIKSVKSVKRAVASNKKVMSSSAGHDQSAGGRARKSFGASNRRVEPTTRLTNPARSPARCRRAGEVIGLPSGAGL